MFSSYKSFKLKFRVFLAVHIVAMVSYCVTKLIAACSPMIGQCFDTMSVTSTDTDGSGWNDQSKYTSWKVLETVLSRPLSEPFAYQDTGYSQISKVIVPTSKTILNNTYVVVGTPVK